MPNADGGALKHASLWRRDSEVRRRRTATSGLALLLAFCALAFADGGHHGLHMTAESSIRVEIVRGPDGQTGLAARARHRVVQRFFSWINRSSRRLAMGVKATSASAETFLYTMSASLLLCGRLR